MPESLKGKENLSEERLSAKGESRLSEEVKAGEWQNLINFSEYRGRSREGRIITVYEAIGNREKQLVGFFYRIVAKDPKKGGEFLDKKVKPLRRYKDFLEDCIGREEGQGLDAPAELKNLLEPKIKKDERRAA